MRNDRLCSRSAAAPCVMCLAIREGSLVAKLEASRERKRATIGKCEGRKAWREINPDLVREASDLAGEMTSTFTA
jgi:hypothetical protein